MNYNKKLHSVGLASAISILFLILIFSTALISTAQPINNNLTSSSQDEKLYGLDFSPYVDGQNPEYGSIVDRNQIIERMKIIAPYTIWIRTYGTGGGLENSGQVAHEMGLKTAIGAWLSSNSDENDKQINELITECKAGYVDLAIVGSETLYRNDLSEDQLINYIKRVKQEAPETKVTTAETYNELINHPNVMAECDVIMYNSYPYWEGVSINNAIKVQENHHKNLVDHVGSKQVIVSETGWPSSGNTVGSAVPSPENASKFFNDFVFWARKNNVQYFYFEAFDETWKNTNEGPQGAYWGVWDKDGNLKSGFEKILPVLPVANFTTNVTRGYAPLPVQFTDNSLYTIGWRWDFGDGTNSTEKSPIHVYNAIGTYIVNLKVSNANGTALRNVKIDTIGDSSSNEGSNSERNSESNSGSNSVGSTYISGSDSAGVSPEPQSNVKMKEISQAFISSGTSVKFNFPRNATSVVHISFDSKKTAGKTIAIVERLKNESTLVSELPIGEIYEFFNIWVGNGGYATSSNIENASVYFKVEKSWIQDKNIDESSITLNRYNDKKWNQLPTSLSNEDDKHLYFTAQTPGFSPFAITGNTTEAVNAVKPATGNKTPSAVDDKQNNAGKATANVEQTPEQTQSSNTSGKESTKTPGFEIASGIVCLLSVFLYRRR